MKIKAAFVGLTALSLLSLQAQATIIATEANADMEIRIGNTVDASASDNGATSASVDIAGATSGATAHSSINFGSLTDESATLNFDIGYDGNGTSSNGYMGQGSPDSNFGSITYRAEVNSVLEYDWSFDYFGSNPFGLQVVRVDQDGNILNTLGDYGQVGHHEGSDAFNLVAGTDYTFTILFSPNVSGGIGTISGDLLGSFMFNFNGSSVPEPGALALLATTLLGFAGSRRKRA